MELDAPEVWQGEVLIELANTMEALGCRHAKATHKSTPPMMYREWLLCVVGKREARLAEAERLLRELADDLHNVDAGAVFTFAECFNPDCAAAREFLSEERE